MKRVWIILISTLLFCGCADKFAPAVPVQTTTEQLAAMAAAQTAPPDDDASGETPAENREDLASRLGVPERFSFAYQSEDGSVRIDGDAPIELPDADALSVVRVKLGGFSQALTDRLYAACCGDAAMFDPAGTFGQPCSQEELRGMIAEVDRLIAYAPQDAEVRGKLREQLRQRLSAAPESDARIAADALLKTRSIEPVAEGAPCGTQTYVHLVSLPEGYGRAFDVVNVPTYTERETVRIEHPDGTVEYIGPINHSSFCYQAAQRLSRYYPGRVLADVTAQSLTDAPYEGAILQLTPAQARQTAARFLQAAGIDAFSVSRVVLYTNRTEAGTLLRQGEQERQCYRVTCARTVAGVPVAALPERSSRTEAGEYGIEWAYENLAFVIDDSGILQAVWGAPLELASFVTEDAALLPFSEIAPILTQTLQAHCRALGPVEAYRVEVTRAALMLQRICDRDSCDEGLLVPVWNVYAVTERVQRAGDPVTRFDEPNVPLLTVNAIDGSVIDLEERY